MNNFNLHTPTRILFGKGAIADLREQIPADARVLITYGGGSVKKNGVLDQVYSALEGLDVREFSGIEPNPSYETLMKAVKIARMKTSPSCWRSAAALCWMAPNSSPQRRITPMAWIRGKFCKPTAAKSPAQSRWAPC
jgi:hypothetical protein